MEEARRRGLPVVHGDRPIETTMAELQAASHRP
jgi:hypothetical protein